MQSWMSSEKSKSEDDSIESLVLYNATHDFVLGSAD